MVEKNIKKPVKKTKKKPEKKLTIKQQKFIANYIKTGNGTQSAKDAGYSKKTAKQIGSENLTKLDVLNPIKAAHEKLGITPEYVLENINRIMKRCMQAEPVYDKHGEHAICSTEDGGEALAYKFESSSALKAAELLGKSSKMFSDKLEITGKDDGPLESKVAVYVTEKDLDDARSDLLDD